MSSSEPALGSGGRGCLVVVSGPSGAGKTSICERLLERIADSMWSVSVTTRPRRGNEVDGANYRFISGEEFASMRDRGELLEWAQYVGNLYGTPADPIRRAIGADKTVILEIDVQGGIQVSEKMPDSVRVFVLPPTRETLEARLKGRETETADQLRRRLAAADGEIAAARDSGAYDHFVTNDDLAETVSRLLVIIEGRTEIR